MGREPAFRGDTGIACDTRGHFLVVVAENFGIAHPTPAQLDSLAAVLALGIPAPQGLAGDYRR